MRMWGSDELIGRIRYDRRLQWRSGGGGGGGGWRRRSMVCQCIRRPRCVATRGDWCAACCRASSSSDVFVRYFSATRLCTCIVSAWLFARMALLDCLDAAVRQPLLEFSDAASTAKTRLFEAAARRCRHECRTRDEMEQGVGWWRKCQAAVFKRLPAVRSAECGVPKGRGL